MSTAPTDLLANRHRAYRQAQDRYRRATAARESAQQRVSELERELSLAESRDRLALGDALVDQRRKPKAEADDARVRLDEAKNELEALQYAEQRAATTLDRVPAENKEEWLRRAIGDLAATRDAYRSSVLALARSRERLADEATLVSFLAHGQQSQPIGAALVQRLSDGSVRGLDFTQLVELMLVEAGGVEDAARLDPHRPQPEPQFHRAYTA